MILTWVSKGITTIEKMKDRIRHILKEEVNKKYPKPTPKLDSIVYRWLDNYFDGVQIYKEESWKYYFFSFDFCKDGRLIADLRVIFDDRSPDWGPRDKRPTSERSVKNVSLFIYPIMVNELLSDIPIRRNYLMYLIEEWFEDTYLNKIQQMLDRNDLALDELDLSSKNQGDKCVPPVTKDDDVTMEDMMFYINQNTLFSYDDMEKYEEDEPGWIEKTYLGKLRQKEQEK